MTARESYDLVVIGGGAAGISAAAAGAGLRARTLLIEKEPQLGGECSWTGCVPSKALLHIAEVVETLRRHGADSQAADLAGQALELTRQRTRQIAEDTGSQAFLEQQMGAEVAYGHARLSDRQEVELDGHRIHAHRVIVATGSGPALPPCEGLDRVDYLTNQNLFELTELPRSLVILGAGPVGLEMAQAFSRLGTKVTVVTRGPRILSKDDPELTETLADLLVAEGIELVRNAALQQVSQQRGLTRVTFEQAGETKQVSGEKLLVAVGRRANLDDLGLEDLGLSPSPAGLALDPYLRTAQRWLFGAGDVVGSYQFSHAAEEEARVAVRNAFFPLLGRPDHRWTPWATFTDPELAHLGPTEEELRLQGIEHRVYRWSFADDDRARVDQRAVGQVKLLATPWGRILGAHVLGPRAGEVANEIVLAARKRLSIADLALTIHIYPTLGMTTQRAADHWFEDLLARPWLRRFVERFTRRT